MKLRAWLLIALAAGCGGETKDEPTEDAAELADGTNVVAIDARGTDGVPWPDAPPGACPDVAVPEPMAASGTPTGSGRRSAWRCVGGCGLYPAPAITRATFVDILPGVIRWRDASGTIAEHAATPTGRCLRVAADVDDGCRAYYDLCSTSGTNRLYVFVASWFDTNTQWRQTWEMNEPAQ